LPNGERNLFDACDEPAALEAALDEIVVAETKDPILAKLR